jgi:hypothetical protein
MVGGLLVGLCFGLLAFLGPAGVALLLITSVAIGGCVVMNSRFSSALYAGLAGEVVMSFDGSEVMISQAGQCTVFAWSSITGWSEDGDRFFVSVAPLVGWPLPKAGFFDHSASNGFRALLAGARPGRGYEHNGVGGS